MLPNALKGADLELFSIFKRLGIYVAVRPVFDSVAKELKRAYNDKLDQLQEDEYQEFLSSLPIGPSNIDLYWKFLLFSRRMKTLEDVDEYAKKNKIQLPNRHLSERFLIGRKLTPFRHSDGDQQDDTLIEVSPYPKYGGVV